MRGIWFFSCLVITILIYNWWNEPCYVQQGTCKVASGEIKRAMNKMGPYKDYRILPNKKLQVKVKGKWLFLKY